MTPKVVYLSIPPFVCLDMSKILEDLDGIVVSFCRRIEIHNTQRSAVNDSVQAESSQNRSKKCQERIRCRRECEMWLKAVSVCSWGYSECEFFQIDLREEHECVTGNSVSLRSCSFKIICSSFPKAVHKQLRVLLKRFVGFVILMSRAATKWYVPWRLELTKNCGNDVKEVC